VGCVLEGEPGIGKTVLCREAVAVAERRGFRVLLASPSEPDASLPFAALVDVFDALPGDMLRVLPEPQRRALATALAAEESLADSPGEHALGRAVLAVLRRLAIKAPVLVAIDDEHWVDAASARALAFAMSRLREGPIALLLTRRPGTGAPISASLERGTGSAEIEKITLGALDLDAIRRLLAERIGRVLSPTLTRRIYEASGGNPLYALAIAQELESRESEDASADPLPIPSTLSDAMTLRLTRVDPRASDALLVIAAASNPTIALLQAVLPRFRLSDLESAELAGVIEVAGERVSFTHPVLASQQYAAAPASRRRELHQALAKVVDNEEQRAYHLALGAEAPDLETARILRGAAKSARRRGAPAEAAWLLGQAIRLTPQQARREAQECAVMAGELHYDSGDLERARSELEAILPEMAAGPWRARGLRQLAVVRYDNLAAAQSLLEEALADVGDDLRLRGRIEVELALVSHNRGNFAGLVDHSNLAVECAQRAEDEGLLAHALGEQALAAFFTGAPVARRGLEAAVEFEDAAEATTFQLPSSVLGQLSLWSDDPMTARHWLERAAQRALKRGEEYDRGAMLILLAFVEWTAGDNESAARYRLAAEDAWGSFGDEPSLWHAWFDSWSAASRGELERARSIASAGLEACVRLWNEATPIAVPYHVVLAAVDLWSADAASAHERLHELRARTLARHFRVFAAMTISLWSCDLEALIALGRLDEATRVLVDMRKRARSSDNPHARAITNRCEGLLLAARQQTDAAIGALERALAEHRRRMLPLEHGRTLLEHGKLLRSAGARDAAAASLDAALSRLTPLDASFWLARVVDELADLGIAGTAGPDAMRPRFGGASAERGATDGRGAIDSLSAREHEVILLVAEGLTDAEIAQRLYLSVKTVQSHLDRIRDKTGARRRAQLTRLALSLRDVSFSRRDEERGQLSG
jgi:DNA-binding CsgD family transcriptional regulator